MEKERFSCEAAARLPPPYEAEAYPRDRPRRRFMARRLASPRFILSLVLTSCVFWLCLLVRRVPRGITGVESTHFADALAQCQVRARLPSKPDPASRTENSRWATGNGQEGRVVLKNATLFDGESFIGHAVDITFSKGLIESVTKTGEVKHDRLEGTVVYDLHGRYVTPGLVDMHSHHMLLPWPSTLMTDDSAEIHPDTKAVTSMMRVIDALKAYDEATPLIASGGITTSLIIPGSANLIGGEGTVVKNALYTGKGAEPVVEELLLERGLPKHERRRYMKMALGENPKGVWGYSRLGNAWHLREHFQKAKTIMDSQDDYCAGLEVAQGWSSSDQSKFIAENGKYPTSLEFDNVIALLRGQTLLQNHNYEPEDLETMIRISEEFGYKITGFHHATEAWQIAGMLKERVPNITVATFAEFSLYKHEAFFPSLYAGHILDKHGIKVAYKSDHVLTFTNAKFLVSQAAIAHSFHLPADKALRSVTSVPAAAIDQDHRVGYCRAGYDADIVVWDDHPLNRGATPLQVFIDGIKQLNESQVEKSTGAVWTAPAAQQQGAQAPTPQVKYEPDDRSRDETCQTMANANGNIVVSGISRSFLENYPEAGIKESTNPAEKLELVISNGKLACVGTKADCSSSREAVTTREGHAVLSLQNGHLVPGLTAVTNALGIREISMDVTTGDGDAGGQRIADAGSVTYAKHGVWLDGKTFARARLGGVTRAITPPLTDGGAFVSGISVEILTSGRKSLLGGGIVQEDVALHIALGEGAMISEGAVSNGVKRLRKMLTDGLGKNNETVYGKVAAGDLPLLVYVSNKVGEIEHTES